MICELCGKREARYRVLIEGAELDLCEFCSKHGKIIKSIYEKKVFVKGSGKAGVLPVPPSVSEPKVKYDEYEIVSDYSKRIQQACRKLHITYHVLAERLNEKESYIEKIMYGKIEPDEKTARKIERELHIKLIEKVVSYDVKISKGLGDMTFGDVVVFKKK